MIIKNILARIGQMIIVLFVLSTITFILMKLTPGDPVDKILHLDVSNVSSNQINDTKDKLGLNDSVFMQYIHWLGQIIHLDLGNSYQTGEPVIKELISFFIGIVLIYIFAQKFQILPSSGIESVTGYILPVLSLSVGMSAYYVRLLRSTLIDLYQSPVVIASRLRGMSETYILWKDLFKPALIPLVTMLGMSVGGLIGGTVVVENLFGIPGLGYFLIDSIRARDYPVIQGAVLFIGTLVVVANIVSDLVLLWLDPERRYSNSNKISEQERDVS